MMALPKLIETMVVHELCHLHQQDPPDAFWNEAETLIPDYRDRKMWLRKYSGGLDL